MLPGTYLDAYVKEYMSAKSLQDYASLQAADIESWYLALSVYTIYSLWPRHR